MLQTVLTTLAKAIAKDGEGATKLIEAETKGASTDLAARMISKTIVGSPLVKTAIYGKDPIGAGSFVQLGIADKESILPMWRSN